MSASPSVPNLYSFGYSFAIEVSACDLVSLLTSVVKLSKNCPKLLASTVISVFK